MAASFVYFLAFLLVGGFAAPQEDPVSIENLENGYFFSNTRIVGGENADENEHKGMASLITGVFVSSFMCGGSIVRNDCVLTAAHCIEAVYSRGSLQSSLRVGVGSNEWRSSTRHGVDRNMTHPNYVSSRIKNDMGLLFTSSLIVFNERTQPVSLSFEHIPGGVPVCVYGWGRTRAGGTLPRGLKVLCKEVIDGDECRERVARHAIENNVAAPAVEPHIEMCTFHSVGQGTCNGDSGSALLTRDKREQVGIVSWGFPCARGAPDMYVKISGFKEWLQNELNN